MKKLFVTGIGTNVGKTIASSIIVESLKADYWKPIQSGDLENSDTMKVKSLVYNSKSTFHNERYKLTAPLSPHAASKIDGQNISVNDFVLPETSNHLVVEGAGGLMVPINHQGDLIIDLIEHLKLSVVLISQNYLGSINHTLLSIQELKRRNINIEALIFNGKSTPESENIIGKISGIKSIFRIPQTETIDKSFISNCAQNLNFE